MWLESAVLSENSIRASSHTFVFVDQPTEPIPPTNLAVMLVPRSGLGDRQCRAEKACGVQRSRSPQSAPRVDVGVCLLNSIELDGEALRRRARCRAIATSSWDGAVGRPANAVTESRWCQAARSYWWIKPPRRSCRRIGLLESASSEGCGAGVPSSSPR